MTLILVGIFLVTFYLIHRRKVTNTITTDSIKKETC